MLLLESEGPKKLPDRIYGRRISVIIRPGDKNAFQVADGLRDDHLRSEPVSLKLALKLGKVAGPEVVVRSRVAVAVGAAEGEHDVVGELQLRDEIEEVVFRRSVVVGIV